MHNDTASHTLTEHVFKVHRLCFFLFFVNKCKEQNDNMQS